ncbi:MAG: polymer-forming cytoskeletal protein [Gammaproteobacteria bacterium]|jgi:cytoskeletal protein CcmA (bactofilin family)|nr:MAG: polymer-forming cytoskeletal protein [Gammaproteobacteria bacterium]
MFGKSGKTRTEITTLVGAGTRIFGDIEFEGGLHLDGQVHGNIRGVEGATLTVGSGGLVDGGVEVDKVVLNGTVQGDVVASTRVELGASARVIGNVVYQVIEMASGAEVNGSLIHHDPMQPRDDRD